MRPDELRRKIKGLIHMPMTIFDKRDEIDEKALRKGLRFALNALKGEDAVFLVTGGTGEVYALTDDELMRVWRIAVEEVGGKFPIIVGAGRPATKLTIQLSQKAQEIGADGVLIISPYYNLVTQEGLYRHFKMIAENIDIGIMIYNNPVMSKMWIPSDLMVQLSKIKNIVADKENTPNAMAYYMMQRAVDPKDMVITTGLGHLMYSFEMLFGSAAFVTEMANFVPQLVIGLYRAARDRDYERVREFIDKLTTYDRFVNQCGRRRSVPSILSPSTGGSDIPVYQSIIKEAMSLVGLPGGKVREPMDQITVEEKKELKEVLKRMGVL